VGADFDDGKDQGALRTIGELGEALGIKAHVLRYWEDQFPTLQPLKRSGGRRYYRPEDVALVREIDRLVNREGYTLRGARTALKDFRMAPVGAQDTATATATATVDGAAARPAGSAVERDGARDAIPAEVVTRLRAIRETLAAALAQ
jgi:DNA-binding transcriptional MerR regulator